MVAIGTNARARPVRMVGNRQGYLARRSGIVAVLFMFVFATGRAARLRLRGTMGSELYEEPAGGEGANPYDIYFKKDWNAEIHKSRPMVGGNRLFRARKDVRGYTPESRYWYNRWRNGPPNVVGKTWVHSCASFPFCNHIPPPPASIPAPWDIPAPLPNPTFPSLHPFPKKLFGEDNFYGRDMYQYSGGFPFYKKSDKFWK